MTDSRELLERQAALIKEQLLDSIETERSGIAFLSDPNDKGRVDEHYGETHLCAALFLEALKESTPVDEKIVKLLEGIIAHHDKDEKHPAYHADFNNFALSVILLKCSELLSEENRRRLTDLLLNSADSTHFTVNWLPMRAYTALTRFRLTGERKHLAFACDCMKKTKTAQYRDGLFEDLLPKGSTLSLQYSISTAAVVQLIYDDFQEYRNELPEIDIEKTMETLYLLELPDGDINYFGRGTNQIFAWGPWLFLGRHYYNKKIESSVSFLSERLEKSVKASNLMLNDFPGAERCLWWDYHHYSVYISHFLFWYRLISAVTCQHTETPEGKDTHTESGFSVWKQNGNTRIKSCIVI